MMDRCTGEIALLQLKTLQLLSGGPVCSFIHSTRLLGSYLMPVSCLDVGDTTEEKTGLCPDGA